MMVAFGVDAARSPHDLCAYAQLLRGRCDPVR